MTIPAIITNAGTINAVVQGKAFSIPSDHENYSKIKAAVIAGDAAGFVKLADVAKPINDFGQGKVTVRNGVIHYGDQAVHSKLTDRVLTLVREGFSAGPLLKFLENLFTNPSKRAVEELYSFLEHKALPITEDGCFLGYKAVQNDWTDKKTGKFSNTIGSVLSMPRNTVDDEWRNECSSGFHVGSLEYVAGFKSGDDRVVIVKVNPADVVSVPENEVTKLRTCKYEVIAEYDVALLSAGVGLSSPVHTAEGAPVAGGLGGYGYEDDDEDDSDIDSDTWDDEDDEDDSDLDDEDQPYGGYRG